LKNQRTHLKFLILQKDLAYLQKWKKKKKKLLIKLTTDLYAIKLLLLLQIIPNEPKLKITYTPPKIKKYLIKMAYLIFKLRSH